MDQTPPTSATPPTDPTPPPTSSTPTEPTPDGTQPPAADPALAVPDTYTFKAPDGQSFDPATIEQASTVFKELGLTQAQADKLIALQPKLAQNSVDNAKAAIREMDKGFEAKLKADPVMGPRLDEIKLTIGRAFDAVLSPAERNDFSKAMFATGLGNHPDIIRVISKLAEKVAPGTHVSGGGPSPHGQSPSGQTARPSAAEAMWPTLPKAS